MVVARPLRIGLEALAVAVAALVAALALYGTELSTSVLGNWSLEFGGDVDGTMWFWTWHAEAWSRGLEVNCATDVCYPEGQCSGRHFLNRGDALFALPFVRLLPFPLSYNVALVAMTVASIGAGYGLLRALGGHPALALVGGLWIGAGPYTLSELAHGRPSSGILVMPLAALACAVMATRASPRAAVGWVLGASVAVAWTISWYIPWLLPLGLVALALAVTRLHDAGWRRVGAVFGGTVAVSVGISIPYLLEVRDRAPHSSDGLTGGGMANAEHMFESLGHASLPYDYLWNPNGMHMHGALSLSIGMVLLLLVALVGVRRIWPLLVTGALLAALALGPVLLRKGAPVTPFEPEIYLPTAWVMAARPTLELAFRPYRVFPFLLMSVWMAAAVGAPTRWIPARFRHAVLGVVGVALVAEFVPFTGRGRMDIGPRPMDVPQVFHEMRLDERDGGVIDIPLSYAFGSATWYAVHTRPRAAVSDALHRTHPASCQTGLARELFHLGFAGHDEPDPSALVADPFRWIVLHKHLERQVEGFDTDAADAWLRQHLGPPQFDDATVSVWELEEAR